MPSLKLSEPSRRLLLPLLLAVLLSSCGGVTLSGIKEQAMSAVSSYKSALYYYESGDIMLARRAALRTDANRPDYAQAQQLLKDKIEPARLKLLRHFRLVAAKAEKRGQLYVAKENFLKAAEVSIDDDSMQKQVERVDLAMRQKRIDQLIEQRRDEDREWLDTLNGYDPQRGLDPKDLPFARELERAQDMVMTRGRNALNAAKRELREGYPEVAYVEAESYQRLRPGSRLGERLMQDVKDVLPKGLRIPGEKKSSRPSMKKPENQPPASISAEQVKALMTQGKWIEAHDYAIQYRRDGGDDADNLLQDIDKNMKRLAESAFRTGQMAFQQEQIDKAVEAWTEAATLQPENRDYTDSLRRATELQERLRILQGNASVDN